MDSPEPAEGSKEEVEGEGEGVDCLNRFFDGSEPPRVSGCDLDLESGDVGRDLIDLYRLNATIVSYFKVASLRLNL